MLMALPLPPVAQSRFE